MTHAIKFAVEAIEQMQRALESIPEYRETEVTKKGAIKMLVPQILAMQSKGYSFGAIAGVLSEMGLGVTPVALKGYLKDAKSGSKKKKTRLGSKRNVAKSETNAMTGTGANAVTS